MQSFSAHDQLFLELLNRARLDPSAEAQRYNIALNRGFAENHFDSSSKQPLAPSDVLRSAALHHSQWMLAKDVFSHTGVGNSNGLARMGDAGYEFGPGSWRWGENIAWVGHTRKMDATNFALQMHKNLFLSPSHRANILNEDFREVGIGSVVGHFSTNGKAFKALMTTHNFAMSGSDLY